MRKRKNREKYKRKEDTIQLIIDNMRQQFAREINKEMVDHINKRLLERVTR
jgi:hypothetical protein